MCNGEIKLNLYRRDRGAFISSSQIIFPRLFNTKGGKEAKVPITIISRKEEKRKGKKGRFKSLPIFLSCVRSFPRPIKNKWRKEEKHILHSPFALFFLARMAYTHIRISTGEKKKSRSSHANWNICQTKLWYTFSNCGGAAKKAGGRNTRFRKKNKQKSYFSPFSIQVSSTRPRPRRRRRASKTPPRPLPILQPPPQPPPTPPPPRQQTPQTPPLPPRHQSPRKSPRRATAATATTTAPPSPRRSPRPPGTSSSPPATTPTPTAAPAGPEGRAARGARRQSRGRTTSTCRSR